MCSRFHADMSYELKSLSSQLTKGDNPENGTQPACCYANDYVKSKDLLYSAVDGILVLGVAAVLKMQWPFKIPNELSLWNVCLRVCNADSNTFHKPYGLVFVFRKFPYFKQPIRYFQTHVQLIADVDDISGSLIDASARARTKSYSTLHGNRYEPNQNVRNRSSRKTVSKSPLVLIRK